MLYPAVRHRSRSAAAWSLRRSDDPRAVPESWVPGPGAGAGTTVLVVRRRGGGAMSGVHVHDWWFKERGIAGSVIREWTCRAPGCKSPPIGQVAEVGAPYPDIPETQADEETEPAMP